MDARDGGGLWSCRRTGEDQEEAAAFIKLPMTWYERLNGAGGQTYRLAWWLLYMHWKDRSQPIKLANGMLGYDGVSRKSKWRALNDLESRGLIVVERRPRRYLLSGWYLKICNIREACFLKICLVLGACFRKSVSSLGRDFRNLSRPWGIRYLVSSMAL